MSKERHRNDQTRHVGEWRMVSGSTPVVTPTPRRPGVVYMSYLDFEFYTSGYNDMACVAAMVVEERERERGGREGEPSDQPTLV